MWSHLVKNIQKLVIHASGTTPGLTQRTTVDISWQLWLWPQKNPAIHSWPWSLRCHVCFFLVVLGAFRILGLTSPDIRSFPLFRMKGGSWRSDQTGTSGMICLASMLMLLAPGLPFERRVFRYCMLLLLHIFVEFCWYDLMLYVALCNASSPCAASSGENPVHFIQTARLRRRLQRSGDAVDRAVEALA